ncbi:hypothetical protein GCK72_021208 [Caenorhabditis remanei]|uniref:F-box domain-containing protein n=1 Tax=Caenorhabditis remanei TaxID=31234 RepID=A0A6A5GJ93_CAERE|nr:hypothetical protein GCK72_021208 [Caenorhabditis remanei]KAF1754645.1 hypothetical protein GCK72_021208 [Caenorhabditis remanei]
MTDIPPNSSIDIRAHVLYDNYQRISTEKSYENYKKLCETMGEEAICYEEYESLFNKYLEESYYTAKDKSSRGLLIPDIRGCILSDVNGKRAEKSIDDLCDAFKNQKIDKEDHDYWFNRFDSGHLFSRVTFSDFPEDVIAEIVERCDIKSYLNLRNVSYGLRTVVDQMAPPCTDIKVTCRNEWVHVHINDARIADSRCFDILELLLKNPKRKLKWFQFMTNPYFREIPTRNHKQDFFNFLNSLDHKIHVKECMMCVDNEKDLIGVLKCLKPGTLEKLNIDIELNGRINEVMNMDQWKLAKHMEIHTYELPPVENFFHFSTFELGIESITLENMVKLFDNASKSINFEAFTLKTMNDINTEEVKRVLNLQPTSSRCFYSIPNTNLIVKFNRWNSNWLGVRKN